MFPRQRLSQAVGILVVASLIRAFMGLVSQMLIAAKFGATASVDAYLIGFTIPTFVGDFLFGGVIFFVLIPIFTELWTREGERQAWNVVSNLIGISVICLAGITLVYFLFAPGLIKLLAPGFCPETSILAVRLGRTISPLIIIFSLAIIFQSVLNAYRNFSIPAIASFTFPLGIIIGVLFFSRKLGIYSLALGAVGGSGLQFLIQWIAVIKMRIGRFIRFSVDHLVLKKIIKLAIPILVVNIAYQINHILIRIFASTLIEGSIAALNFARYPIIFVVDFVGATIGTVIFPVMSQQKATNDLIDLGHTFSLSLRMIIFISIPLSVGLMILSGPIVKLLFARGEFSTQAVRMTTDALFYYSWGLFAFTGNVILVRVFYSLQDMMTPLKIGIIGIIINVIAGLILKDILGVGGLALAFSIYGTIVYLLLAWFLRKRLETIQKKRILITFTKTLIASAVMGIIIRIITFPVLVTVLIGGIVFFIIALILKMDELDMMKDVALKLFTRGDDGLIIR